MKLKFSLKLNGMTSASLTFSEQNENISNIAKIMKFLPLCLNTECFFGSLDTWGFLFRFWEVWGFFNSFTENNCIKIMAESTFSFSLKIP